jgi:uncharacterized protein (TIGR03790 family)
MARRCGIMHGSAGKKRIRNGSQIMEINAGTNAGKNTGMSAGMAAKMAVEMAGAWYKKVVLLTAIMAMTVLFGLSAMPGYARAAKHAQSEAEPAAAPLEDKPVQTGKPVALPALPALPAQSAQAARLQAGQLALIVNDDDPNSVAVAQYYQKARHIPPQNIIHIVWNKAKHRLTQAEFAQLRRNIEIQLQPHIEAILMVWSSPYAVECQSITSALSLGFDPGLCKNPCATSKPSAYFDSPLHHPFREIGLRPSMLLPTDSIELAKSVIDRGVASSFRLQSASAYYVQTADTRRNSRAPLFPGNGSVPDKKLNIKRVNAEALTGVQDIMIYQIGAVQVPQLDTVHFLPGALADHLTSYGGDLAGDYLKDGKIGAQMSSVRWLQAGATASFGSVSEPCSYPQKFPHPQVLLKHYLAGDTAIEAYWKSVAWPAQALFIGEPLAAPYAR